MKRDQLSAAIVKSGMIDDVFIILCAQYAFMQSGHDKEHISAIDVGWATGDAAYETVQCTVVYQEKLFRWFQDYYDDRLKRSFENGDQGTVHQAHHVSEVETRMKHMEAKLDRSRDNVEQLHENQEELAFAYHLGERTDTISRVPSAITTGDRTAISAEMVGKMVADGMALAIKELRREAVPRTNRRKTTPGDNDGPPE